MRILLIGHPYHKKTKSNKFFIDFLRGNGHKVSVKYYQETGNIFRDPGSINNQNLLEIISEYKKNDLIIFWQVNPLEFPEPAMRKIFIPMLDGVATKGFDFFYSLRNYEFVTFSKSLHEYLLRHKLNSYRIRFFPQISTKKAKKINLQK